MNRRVHLILRNVNTVAYFCEHQSFPTAGWVYLVDRAAVQYQLSLRKQSIRMTQQQLGLNEEVIVITVLSGEGLALNTSPKQGHCLDARIRTGARLARTDPLDSTASMHLKGMMSCLWRREGES
jgi:hypothetical protein